MEDKYKSQMFNMMLACAIISTCILIGVIVSFRERPGAPLFNSYQKVEGLIEGKDAKQEELSLMQ